MSKRFVMPGLPARWAACLGLAMLITACGGGGDSSGGAVTSAAPAPVAPPAPGTGTLDVFVTDENGRPLSGASVLAFSDASSQLGSGTTGVDGIATLTALPASIRLGVSHPLGLTREDPFAVAQNARTRHPIVVIPWEVLTTATLPGSIPTADISSDRMELDLRLQVLARQFSFSNWSSSGGTVSLRLDDCYFWRDTARLSTACMQGARRVPTPLEMNFDGRRASLPGATGPVSTLLLLDQSARATRYDPSNLRSLAARQFVRRAGSANPIAVAGFAGQGKDPSSSPALPMLPLWVPATTPAAYSSDRNANEARIEALEALTGGGAPVFAALQAAMNLTVSDAPAAQRRAIVALLGGGDDGASSDTQRRGALAALRQRRAETGVQFVLIAGRLAAGAPERAALAELADALQAPLIFAGYPDVSFPKYDGLYAALELAADLVTGIPLPLLDAAFRMKSDQPQGFRPGELLRGTLWLESNFCPMDCRELPREFAVTIP